MTRRVILSAISLAVLGGVATPALADSLGSSQGGDNQICILGNNHSNGTRDGICVGVPTDWSQQR